VERRLNEFKTVIDNVEGEGRGLSEIRLPIVFFHFVLYAKC